MNKYISKNKDYFDGYQDAKKDIQADINNAIEEIRKHEKKVSSIDTYGLIDDVLTILERNNIKEIEQSPKKNNEREQRKVISDNSPALEEGINKDNALIIELPDEFVEHFNRDHFKDSLERIAFDIGERLKNQDITNLAGNYELETIKMLESALEASVSLNWYDLCVYETIAKHSYPIRHGVNNIDQGMTLPGIQQAINENMSCLTQEIEQNIEDDIENDIEK